MMAIRARRADATAKSDVSRQRWTFPVTMETYARWGTHARVEPVRQEEIHPTAMMAMTAQWEVATPQRAASRQPLMANVMTPMHVRWAIRAQMGSAAPDRNRFHATMKTRVL